MMRAHQNMMRIQAAMMAGARVATRIGTVKSYDPAHYAAKVILQPDNIETGWMPVSSIWVGSGWGVYAPPSIGDMVEIAFVDGSIDAGIICGRLYNDQDKPAQVNSGEFWLLHTSGSFLKFTNDQKVSLNGQVELDLSGPTINITATSAVNVTAPAVNIGASGQSLLALVTAAFETLFNAHTHSGVTAGGATTGAPVTPMTASHLTSTIKGG